jgi:hypothetical protein
MMCLLSVAFLLTSLLGSTLAFVFPSTSTVAIAAQTTSSSSQASSSSSSSLNMAPKFDKAIQKWSPSSPDEGPGAGYGVTKTLLRHGPKAFLQRVLTPDEYEQAVLKFMAGDQCSRDEAQGNMDAYFENANDWAYNRMYTEKTGIKIDYVTLRQGEVIKTLTWAGIVFFFVFRLFIEFSGIGGFWDFLH